MLVPLEGSNELCELSLADGRVTSTAAGVGRQPHDAAQTAGGTIVVTNELGGGVVFVRDGDGGRVTSAGPVQPGGVAAVGDYAAVADVQGNGVWVYDGSTRRQMAQGPVGVKLTHAVAMSGDLAAFADTDGGAVFVERIDPQLSPGRQDRCSGQTLRAGLRRGATSPVCHADRVQPVAADRRLGCDEAADTRRSADCATA